MHSQHLMKKPPPQSPSWSVVPVMVRPRRCGTGSRLGAGPMVAWASLARRSCSVRLPPSSRQRVVCLRTASCWRRPMAKHRPPAVASLTRVTLRPAPGRTRGGSSSRPKSGARGIIPAWSSRRWPPPPPEAGRRPLWRPRAWRKCPQSGPGGPAQGSHRGHPLPGQGDAAVARLGGLCPAPCLAHPDPAAHRAGARPALDHAAHPLQNRRAGQPGQGAHPPPSPALLSCQSAPPARHALVLGRPRTCGPHVVRGATARAGPRRFPSCQRSPMTRDLSNRACSWPATRPRGAGRALTAVDPPGLTR